MSKEIIIRPGQSVTDIAIEHAGQEDAAWTIAELNNISITEVLTAGQTLLIPDVDGNAQKRIVKVFSDNGYHPASDVDIDTEILEGIEYWGIEYDFIVS